MTNDPRRSALKAFLRAMRARLSPADAGFPAERRRMPGLRIEEAAALAGVSLTWYSALEGGKDIRVSSALLEKVASALRLDAAERDYLHALAAPREAAVRSADDTLLQRVVDGFTGGPGMVIDVLWNVLAFNRIADAVYGIRVAADRNLLRRMFLDVHMRTLHRNWEDIAVQMVAILRASYGRTPKDGEMLRFIAALASDSPDFARWWDDQRVQRFEPKTAVLAHPTLGELTFHLASFVEAAATQVEPATFVLLQPAADPATEARLGDLAKANDAGPPVAVRPSAPAARTRGSRE